MRLALLHRPYKFNCSSRRCRYVIGRVLGVSDTLAFPFLPIGHDISNVKAIVLVPEIILLLSVVFNVIEVSVSSVGLGSSYVGRIQVIIVSLYVSMFQV